MYRERLTWSPVALLVLFSPVVLVLVLVLLPSSGERAAGLAIVGVMAVGILAVTYAFRALQITLDDQHLTVGFPIYRERVPLDQIIACRPIRYRWWEFGGYGLRWGRRGKMLNVAGDGGRAVELKRRDRGTLLFSSRHPEAICAAIRARRPEVACA